MKRVGVTAVVALAAAACIEPQAASPATQGSVLVRPGQSPPPTTSDATMPASFPPPPAAASVVQTNGLYRTGSTLISVGAAGIGAGIAFAVLGAVLPCKLGDPDCPTQADVDSQKSLGNAFLGTGIGAMILGAVFVAVGIPLAIVGANQVKRQLGYALLVTPNGAGFRF